VNPIATFLDKQGFAVLDGALATEMEKRGADLDDPLWSAKQLFEAPELVRAVHLDYLHAGADVIATATYQASFEGFANAGFDHEQAEGLMRLSVDLAVLARETFWSSADARLGRLRPLVAASIGPYGAILHDGSEYHGNYEISREELREFHRQRLLILDDTDADLFAFETIPSMEEGEVLVELLQDFPQRSAWLSFSCRDGESVSHGERFADCAALARATDQVAAVGLNCTPPQFAEALLASAADLGTPLVCYPNSGEHWCAEDNRWEGQGSTDFPIAAWFGHGARLVGGCCRTGPDDIRRIRAELLGLADR